MPDSPHSFYPRLQLLIDGQWAAASDGATRPVIDPATEEEIGRLPIATQDDVQRALAAAERGFALWRRTAPAARAAIIVKAAALVRERADAIARTITLELGKPLPESFIEVERLAVVFEWHAAESLRAYGRIVPAAPGIEHKVIREPVGVVAAFTPWNGPGASPARKMSAALAAGCAVVIKPAEETPGTAILLAHCLVDAGVPAGVLNMVFGDPAAISEQLIASPIVRSFAFTGSVPIGRHLARLAAEHLKPAVMELGGHSPVIVCADADPVRTAEFCARTKYRNAGQICMSPTRFYVHESIVDRFTDAFIDTARAIKVGNGFEPGIEMGPLANARRRDAMEQLIGQATQAGAKLRAGGTRLPGKGFFFAPAVLTDIPDSAQVLQTEPFGPVGLISPFATLDDAIARANGTPYGLAGYAFTDSAAAAHQIGAELECGVVSINHFQAAGHDTPFGGVKDSGYGREGGAECFEGYLGTKLVSHKTR
jgi:succinate-semialdehyde dehydrogenase/glutarate-semialdehyde dehydrogenase